MKTAEKVLVGAAVVYGAGFVVYLLQVPSSTAKEAAIWPLALPYLIANAKISRNALAPLPKQTT
jgi:hypothetical protein